MSIFLLILLCSIPSPPGPNGVGSFGKRSNVLIFLSPLITRVNETIFYACMTCLVSVNLLVVKGGEVVVVSGPSAGDSGNCTSSGFN